MYSYSWDAETGGLLLNSSPLPFSKEPRPVYYKELDILGFDKYWNYAKNDTYISPIEPPSPAIKKPVKTGLWREHCEDGSQYGLYPEDFATADDYADALKVAKEQKTPSPFATESIPSTSQEQAQSGNRYRWRKHCEDGSKYGVFPEDYETADDYEDALAGAKKQVHT